MAKGSFIEHFKAGRTEKGPGYFYFIPTPVNCQWLWEDPELSTLLEQASIKLGQLNSFAALVPDIDLFLQLHVKTEAVLSSKIEGTQTNIEEAFLTEDQIDPERKDDWLEVQNYTQALNESIQSLNRLPLSSRILRKAHKTLMQGVRGGHKDPGEFRLSQNWIGGSSPSTAAFVPPAPSYLNEMLSDLENFLHNESINVPLLIRIGIAHYQFETIHPFLDGNGRIGRLLITLYLVSAHILDRPLLYLSAFFERDKDLYYEKLTRVRTHDDLLQWIKYFLKGVKVTASRGALTLSNVIKLKIQIEKSIPEVLGRRSPVGHMLLNFLFKKPYINIKDVEEHCKLSTKAANSLVSAFAEQRWLKPIHERQRYRVFVFAPYMELFTEV